MNFCIHYRCIYIYLSRSETENLLRKEPLMRTAIYLSAALLVFGVFLAKLRATPARPGSRESRSRPAPVARNSNI